MRNVCASWQTLVNPLTLLVLKGAFQLFFLSPKLSSFESAKRKYTLQGLLIWKENFYRNISIDFMSDLTSFFSLRRVKALASSAVKNFKIKENVSWDVVCRKSIICFKSWLFKDLETRNYFTLSLKINFFTVLEASAFTPRRENIYVERDKKLIEILEWKKIFNINPQWN